MLNDEKTNNNKSSEEISIGKKTMQTKVKSWPTETAGALSLTGSKLSQIRKNY